MDDKKMINWGVTSDNTHIEDEEENLCYPIDDSLDEDNMCYPEEDNSVEQETIEIPLKENEEINWGNTTGIEVEETTKEEPQEINWGNTETNYPVQEQMNKIKTKHISNVVDNVKDDFKEHKKDNYENVIEDNTIRDKKPLLELRKLLGSLFSAKGRTRRREYFIGLFQLSSIIVILVALIIKLFSAKIEIFGIACIIISILYLIASLFICIRRLHDIGKSGLYLFTLFVPIWNIVTTIQIYFSNSKEDNKWGVNPKRFDEYANRPLWKSLFATIVLTLLAILIMGKIGVSSFVDTYNQINARQLYDEMEENYNNMYSEDSTIDNNETIDSNKESNDSSVENNEENLDNSEERNNTVNEDDSWKDELENHEKEDKKQYLWGDDAENHPWTTKPESYDSFAEPKENPEENPEE